MTRTDLGATMEDLGVNDVGGLLPVERQATVEHLITARSGVYHLASNAGDDEAQAQLAVPLGFEDVRALSMGEGGRRIAHVLPPYPGIRLNSRRR